jgi:hypothetical protein
MKSVFNLAFNPNQAEKISAYRGFALIADLPF